MTTLWERVKSGSKVGFDKTWQALDKVGTPVNRLSNKLGSEAFWPTTLDKECDKAARILKSFCKDGFYAEDRHDLAADGPKQSQKVIKKIPAEVIRKAKGLAIFTTMRTGLWFSGAGGSGILIARKEDGSWSPPSGILLHTAGLGFMVGIDIYDCVVVINSEKALEAFYKVRCTLGSEISVAAGPVGAGGVLDTELHKRQAPIFTYMKSRGFYAGVQIDGTVIIERSDENERFYGQRIAVKDILGGKVRHPPFEVRRLLETIKAAQGDAAYDASALPSEPPPGDYDVVDDGRVFGVPDKEDPDPYGVLALEKEGMKVVEAGTQKRASWEQFSFNPSPTSPVHPIFNRDSAEYRRSASQRGSWRASLANGSPTTPPRPSSLRQSVDMWSSKRSTMVDSSTQTDLNGEEPVTLSQNERPERYSNPGMGESFKVSPLHPSEDVATQVNVADALDEKAVAQGDSVLHTAKIESLGVSSANGYTTPPMTPPMKHMDPESDQEDAEIVIPRVHSAQNAQSIASPVVSKARLVTVTKRAPPKLPPRNPSRAALSASPDSKASDAVEVLAPIHDFEPLAESHQATPAPAQPHEPDTQVNGVVPEVATIDQEHQTSQATASINDHSRPDKNTLSIVTSSLEDSESKRFSSLSAGSAGSSTWDKVRAMRQIDDDDDDD